MASREIDDTRCDAQTDEQPTTACPDCDGTLRRDSDETVCLDCGLIVTESRLDRRGPRTFSEDPETQARTGAPLTPARHDRGLSTEIGFGTDGTGKTLPGEKRRQLARLRREHRRAQWQSTADRNLAHGCSEIARLVASLGLAREIREQASSLFRTAQRKDLLRGRSVEGIAAGCVYAVCRCTDVIRTLDEVGMVAQCSRGRVKHAYNVLNRTLGLPAPPQRPRAFVASIASDLDLPPNVECTAREVVIEAEHANVSPGAKPRGVAAAGLLVAIRQHGLDSTQQAVARTAEISPTTVRTHRDRIRATVLE